LVLYANSYDGYVNVRAAASSKSKVVCKLYNGDDGAERLGTEGNWVKIRYNGKVGYVHKDYIQNTPTAPVYLDAADIVGVWSHEIATDPYELDLLIFDNGQFAIFNCEASSGYSIVGKWRLEEDRIVFSIYYEDDDITSYDLTVHRIVDKRNQCLYEQSYVIDGNIMSSEGDIFIKRTFPEWIRKENFLEYKKDVSNVMK
jgi:uncharacterized protein YgiM (DUF1202 family)